MKGFDDKIKVKNKSSKFGIHVEILGQPVKCVIKRKS